MQELTGAEMIDTYTDLVHDESMDRTVVLRILNSFKGQLERKYKPRFATGVDTSNSTTAGNNYLTGIDLSSLNIRKILSVYVGTARQYPVPFSEIVNHREDANRFAWNAATEELHLTGQRVGGDAIRISFLKQTANIEDSATAYAGWPGFDEYHMLIVYEGAKKHYPADAGDRNQSWYQEWRTEAKELESDFADAVADQILDDMGETSAPDINDSNDPRPDNLGSL